MSTYWAAFGGLPICGCLAYTLIWNCAQFSFDSSLKENWWDICVQYRKLHLLEPIAVATHRKTRPFHRTAGALLNLSNACEKFLVSFPAASDAEREGCTRGDVGAAEGEIKEVKMKFCSKIVYVFRGKYSVRGAHSPCAFLQHVHIYLNRYLLPFARTLTSSARCWTTRVQSAG